MPLKMESLVKELRIFGDDKYSDFTAYPKGTDETKLKWATAMFKYMKDFECIVPPLVTPPTKVPDMSSYLNTFKNTLKLPQKGTPEAAAMDFATAWATAMNSIVLTPGGLYAGIPTSPITAIVPLAAFISAQQPILYNNLLTIFKGPGWDKSREVQLKKIATAFHTATLAAGGPTTCTYTIVPPPFSAVGPLGFG